MPFFQCAFLQSFSTFLAFFARMGKRLKQRDKILGTFLLLSNCPFFLCLHPTRDQRCLLYLYFHVSLHLQRKNLGINFGVWETAHLPRPKPNILPQVRSKCQCWLGEGVGGQFPRNVNWSESRSAEGLCDHFRLPFLLLKRATGLIVSSSWNISCISSKFAHFLIGLLPLFLLWSRQVM